MDKSKKRHMKTGGILLFSLILFSIIFSPFNGRAETSVRIDVKTILASQKNRSVDPRLQNLINELQSVFKYSSYEFLGNKNINLTLNRSGTVPLPENRTMKILFRGIDGKRVKLELEILKKNTPIFQTVIKLRNKSSITIGGPKYKGGNLLFNIFASF